MTPWIFVLELNWLDPLILLTVVIRQREDRKVRALVEGPLSRENRRPLVANRLGTTLQIAVLP